MTSPGWVVSRGQCGMLTEPPVTAAAARNGVALDRSGSTSQSTARISPGCTTQVCSARGFSGASTRTSA
ncbi:Uncharacterised protein [Mycobacteroides abscessus subsp. abscessus]|nr:Uncharacterised protein [Mycobacteroides abscessus subsp. abscessus]